MHVPFRKQWPGRPLWVALGALLFMFVSVHGAWAGAAIAVGPAFSPGATALTSIACVDAHTCYATSGSTSSDKAPEILTLTDGMVTDQRPIGGARSLGSIDCVPGGGATRSAPALRQTRQL